MNSRRAVVAPKLKVVDVSKGQGRTLSPDELKKAAARGKKIVGYAPSELHSFLSGNRTLGEIEGISKEEQYQMAKLGYRFLTEGKLKDAKQIFFGLTALDPFDTYFITALASAHQQSGDALEAERLYSRALEMNPFATTARAHRGELRALSGRLTDAVSDLARAIVDDPEARDPAVKRAAVLLKAIQQKLQ
jgi:tetratricopeptide (TPR) repeat protein